MTRRHPEPPARRTPYQDDHERSTRVKGDRITHRPTTVRALLSWLQREYALEAPGRLHDRDVADDGAPDHTGEAKSYIGLSQDREPNDWKMVACRSDDSNTYLTPMRCAIARIGDPDRRQLLGGLAVNLFTPLDVTRAQGIPDWCAFDVMSRSLDQLYAMYQERPIPRRSPKWTEMSDSQRAAIEDGEKAA